MKRWFTTFSAVLVAGLLVFYVADKKAAARDAHDREIATWEAKAKELRAELKAESDTLQWSHPVYESARFHLDRAPAGVGTDDLKFAIELARVERDIEIKAKSKK